MAWSEPRRWFLHDSSTALDWNMPGLPADTVGSGLDRTSFIPMI